MLTHVFPVDFALGKRSARRARVSGPRCLRICKQRSSMQAGKTRPPVLRASNTMLRCSAACGKSRIRTASPRWMSTKACNQSAPSITAQTSLAWTSWRRRVSTSAKSVKWAASVRREKYERSPTCTCSGSAEPDWNRSNGQRADFCPCSPGQGNHRSIRADGQARGGVFRGGFFLPRLMGFGGLLVLDLFANGFAEPAGCFWADVHPEQIFEHLACMAKRHPTSQLDEMALLPGRQGAGK